MDNNKRLEGEEIQKGLESFLEQELDLTLAQPEPKPTLQDPIVYSKPELDLSMANIPSRWVSSVRYCSLREWDSGRSIVPRRSLTP